MCAEYERQTLQERRGARDDEGRMLLRSVFYGYVHYITKDRDAQERYRTETREEFSHATIPRIIRRQHTLQHREDMGADKPAAGSA